MRKGSLNLDALKGKGKARATLPRSDDLLGHARRGKTANEVGRPDLMRSVNASKGSELFTAPLYGIYK